MPTDLYTHIKNMIYLYNKYQLCDYINHRIYVGNVLWRANLESLNQILTGIESQFSINPLLLIPPILVMVLAYRKIPDIVIGVIAAGFLGVIFQGNNFGKLLTVAYGGYVSNSGIEAVVDIIQSVLLQKSTFHCHCRR